MSDDWIESAKELPACDGNYLVCNDLHRQFDKALLEYDGIGFKYNGVYIMPNYWKVFIPPPKKYGKQ